MNSTGQTQNLCKLLGRSNMLHEKICSVFGVGVFLGILTVEKAEVAFKLVH